MDHVQLEITKLRWRTQILQGILVKLWTDFYSVRMDEPPLQSVQRLLAELEISKEHQYALLFASALPADQRFLLADIFADVVEEMKTFITSMLADT